MASKASILVFFLSINLLCSSLVRSLPPILDPDDPISTPVIPGSQPRCPREDALKLGVCTNLLGKTLELQIGGPPKKPCCTLLGGLLDLEVAVCLCTAIKANILGIDLTDIPLALNLILGACGKFPVSFKCDNN